MCASSVSSKQKPGRTHVPIATPTKQCYSGTTVVVPKVPKIGATGLHFAQIGDEMRSEVEKLGKPDVGRLLGFDPVTNSVINPVTNNVSTGS